MGRRGPPPTPTKILEARGSWRAKARPREPKAPAGAPSCPSWLSAPARETWRKLVPILARMRVLSKADRNALARYSSTFARWREATEWLQKNSPISEVWGFDEQTEREVLISAKEHPYVRIAADLSKQLAQIEQQFGLTPAARARLTATEEEVKKDDNSRFLKIG